MENENCISLLLFKVIWNLYMSLLKIMTVFICSFSNLKGDKNNPLVGFVARLSGAGGKGHSNCGDFGQ